MVARSVTDSRGKVHEYYLCDPDYRPPLPKGAVRGDVRKQHYCSAYDTPRYFYVDESKTCVQCGDEFLFSGREQKYWYESLRFHYDSVAIRCPRCRRRRRTENALREQIGATRRKLAEKPRDPALLLELAETIVRCRQLSGEGDLDEAISAARRARKEWPETTLTDYWEAMGQIEAGRPSKARRLLEKFLAKPPRGRRHKALLAEAKEALGAIEEA